MKVVHIDVEPVANDNFAVARFAAAIPKNPKAVLILLPGSSGDGRDLIEWAPFADFAEKNNVATVGCYFTDLEMKVDEDYVDAKGGSGDALDYALQEIGLDKLPILIWGFSAGGEFSYEYACFNPDKVIGFIVNKGGVYYTALAPKKTREIPAIFFVGEKDALYRRSILYGIYNMNVVTGPCNWRIVQEPLGHEIGVSITESLKLFEEILKGR